MVACGKFRNLSAMSTTVWRGLLSVALARERREGSAGKRATRTVSDITYIIGVPVEASRGAKCGSGGRRARLAAMHSTSRRRVEVDAPAGRRAGSSSPAALAAS